MKDDPFYEFGDEVRIWTVMHRPSGTVMRHNEEKNTYTVQYVYPGNGDTYTEDFPRDDLTLVQRLGRSCECGVDAVGVGGIHSDHCPKASKY